MILPRGRAARQRYGRNKVVAALVTFAVLWIWLTYFAPDWRDALAGFGTRTPAYAFRERLSGVTVQTRAVVEEVLPDSSAAGPRPLRRARLRTLDGHPFTLQEATDEPLPLAPGDTVVVRGLYDWGLRGGAVTVTDEGWLRPSP